MTKLASTTVEVGGSANITFTNVPQGYTDLYVKVSARSNRADTNDFLKIYFNGVTTGLTLRNLGGDGSSISTGTDSASFYGRLPGNTATASTFGNGKFYIPNYSGNGLKTISSDTTMENNGTYSAMFIAAGLWNNSSPITQVTLEPYYGTLFLQHSTATLYGVKDAQRTAGNSIKATGGNIIFDGTYVTHVFTSTGAFVPTQPLTADILVVAGGGAGGGNGFGFSTTQAGSGGGGAGGYRILRSQYLAASSATVTVGAGGAGVAGFNAGGSGSASSCLSINTSGGGGGGSNYNGSGTNAGMAGVAGGSGGGSGGTGRGADSASGGSGNAGSYSPVEGFAGGNISGNRGGAGGGGAGGVGASDADDNLGCAGGPGSNTFLVWGNTTDIGVNGYFAGGGGGGGFDAGNFGVGGIGGGGRGGTGNWSSIGTNGFPGVANTGSGGGGAGPTTSGNTLTGGNGGSGTVIIRYKG
jgi:hypothetical protein